MRHAAVSYFENGRPVRPDEVPLTEEGVEQARAAAAALAGVRFDRVVTSGLPRTEETARHRRARRRAGGVARPARARGRAASATSRRTSSSARSCGALHGSSPRTRGSSAARRSASSSTACCRRSTGCWPTRDWDVVLAVLHGGVNRAILSYALTGGAEFLGSFEQAPACINVLDVGERAGSCARSTSTPYDPMHLRGRADDDGGAVDASSRACRARCGRRADPARPRSGRARRDPRALEEALDRRGRPRPPGADLDADGGLRLRARPERPPLGRATRARRASTRSC